MKKPLKNIIFLKKVKTSFISFLTSSGMPNLANWMNKRINGEGNEEKTDAAPEIRVELDPRSLLVRQQLDQQALTVSLLPCEAFVVGRLRIRHGVEGTLDALGQSLVSGVFFLFVLVGALDLLEIGDAFVEAEDFHRVVLGEECFLVTAGGVDLGVVVHLGHEAAGGSRHWHHRGGGRD